MLSLLFVVFVLLGFLFHFLGTFPVPYASRLAWGFWLAAALLWALAHAGAR